MFLLKKPKKKIMRVVTVIISDKPNLDNFKMKTWPELVYYLKDWVLQITCLNKKKI